MGALYGQQSTLTATDANLRINIEDLVVKYPDWQFPLLKRLGSDVFKREVRSHKYEWTERDLRPVKTTLASASIDTSVVSFYVTDEGVFNKDDVILIGDEQMVVASVTGGTYVTVVARGHGGSTAASAVLGATVSRVGVASPQGALADNMVITMPEDLYNFAQIFEDVVEMSDTQYKSFIHGDENSSQLIERKQKELMEMLQVALVLGLRSKDAVNKRYTLGGIKYFIDTYATANAIDFGGSWTTDATVIGKIEDAIEKIADKNGGKPTIWMGYKAMRKLRMVDDDLIKTTRDDKERGIGVVTKYLSQLGDLDVVMLRDRVGAFDDLIFFVDENAIGYKPVRNRGWFTEEKPYAGDGHLWQVVGEYTLKMETPKAAAYLYNLGL